MQQIRKAFFLITTLLCLLLPYSSPAQQPLLLKKYKDQQITGWLISEKLDGIRALWNGRELTSRRGVRLAAPDWFLQGFPPFALDGELWSKRGDFAQIQSIVMQQQPHAGWRELTYNIFDVPQQAGGLKDRLDKLRQWTAEKDAPYLRIIPQIICRGKSHLRQYQQEIEALGGEGVVIRDSDAPYIHGRTDLALKVKRFDDTECKVIGHNPGNGKLKGLTGSLSCQLADGTIFRLGSGLTDAQRKNPPAAGSIVTFKHQGKTADGLPRFPVFMHVRVMEPEQ